MLIVYRLQDCSSSKFQSFIHILYIDYGSVVFRTLCFPSGPVLKTQSKKCKFHAHFSLTEADYALLAAKEVLTSTIVMRDSCDVLMTCIVFSQHRLYTPSTPVSPIPSTKSRVRRNGTVSGVGRNFPCSNATPKIKHRRTASVLLQMAYSPWAGRNTMKIKPGFNMILVVISA